MRLFSLLFCALFAAASDREAVSQEIVVDEALLLGMPAPSGRNILSMDPVEGKRILSAWKAPAEGERVAFGGRSAVWEKIKARDGWFAHESMGNAYVHATVEVPKGRVMILEAMGATYFYVNGVPGVGSKYGVKDQYASWEPRFDYVSIPVRLEKGKNALLFRCTRGRLKIRLSMPRSYAALDVKDATLPDLIAGESGDFFGSVLLVHAGEGGLGPHVLSVTGTGLDSALTEVPRVGPMTIRKIPFRIRPRGAAQRGGIETHLKLFAQVRGKYVLRDTASVFLSVKEPGEVHRRTRISGIDGSIQYYAVNPASIQDPACPPAVVLTVHGAGVEAIGQANAYSSKSWAHIVAPTNRRPFGYDWEDWGRLDALETLADFQSRYATDPERVYLTGHSMGGHGAWHLAVTYPDLFAATGPSAGWISFSTYAPRQSEKDASAAERMLSRPMRAGNTLALAHNLKQMGVYILHGKKDSSVPVQEAERMAAALDSFHTDFTVHLEEGADHWWDVSDEPGTDCVDWAPMFDFFSRHALPGKERIREFDFLTANPGVSSRCQWAEVEAQVHPWEISRVWMRLDPHLKRFSGVTENVLRLSLDCTGSRAMDTLSVILDGDTLAGIPRPEGQRLHLVRNSGHWKQGTVPPGWKNPHRNGPFKDAFRNCVQFVYGTGGTSEENDWAYDKARFDAQNFWYQGNGSVDVIPDTEFDPDLEPNRNVVLYGNARTNKAWRHLLKESPVQVTGGSVSAGGRTFKGNAFACLFVRPRPGSDSASVGVVSGSGLQGMRLTDTRPYLYAGYAFPDLTLFTYSEGECRLLGCGFFGEDWSIGSGEFEWSGR